MRIRRADGSLGRAQAGWIAAIDPWRSLGYDTRRLGAWLARMGRAGRVLVAQTGSTRAAGSGGAKGITGKGAEAVQGLIVVQPEVLLGDFIALLAVRPEAAGQGVGRALVEKVAARTFAGRRWLYVSSDAGNRAAAGFYRKLGFARVGRLPDLVQPGRVEVLWRKGRPGRSERVRAGTAARRRARVREVAS